MDLNRLRKRLLEYRGTLEKANLNAKSVPSIPSSADMGDERDKKMVEEKHMNGVNTKQYNYDGEKVVHDRVPKEVAHFDKQEEGPDIASPDKPKGLDNKRKPVTHDECGRPFAKEDGGGAITPKDINAFMRMSKEKRDAHPDKHIYMEHLKVMGVDEDDLGKDENDAASLKNIQDKIRQEMDRRKFTEVDATRHIIDRDRGDKMPEKPKEKPLLQAEMIKYDNNGQWSIEKSNYGPKGWGMYSQKDNTQRKMKNTGESFENAGKNVNAKKYTTSGSSMSQAHEAAQEKKYKQQAKQSLRTLADMSPEEKAELEAKYNTKVKE